MQEAGNIVAETFLLLAPMIAPGVTTEKLDKEAEKFIRSKGAVPAFKGYRGFPAAICTSINEEVVHGIPSKRKLVEGDIVSIDIGVRHKGYHGDAARTFAVGKVSRAVEKLLQVCQECLESGIKAARPGNKVSDISRSIQVRAEADGYGVVKDYTGHGIGTAIHEDPQIPNYVDNTWLHLDFTLKSGYCLAIEPMVNLGTDRTKTVKRQGWDVVITQDKKWSAHFEHSVVVLDEGPLILTLPQNDQAAIVEISQKESGK